MPRICQEPARTTDFGREHATLARAHVSASSRCRLNAVANGPAPAPQRSVKLKFAPDTGFHAEVKRRVDAYFEASGLSPKASASMVVKSAVLIAWFAASYALLVFVATTWWHALLLSGSLAFAMGGIAFAIQHDANHGAYSDSPVVNRLMGFTLDVLGASSYIWHWKHNIAHHTYTNLSGADSDIEVPFGRLTPAQPYRRFHRFQRLYIGALYSVFVAYWHLYEDFQQVAVARISGSSFPRPRGGRLFEMILGKVLFFGWAFVVPALVHPLWVVLLGYALTSMLLSFILIVVFQVAHSVEQAGHPVLAPGERHVSSSWAVHQVETTVDFARDNRVLCWYLGGLNFQIEHHLFPRICHVHYPQIAKIVEATCAEHGVRYVVHGTFPGAIAEHFRWIGRMGQVPQAEAAPALATGPEAA